MPRHVILAFATVFLGVAQAHAQTSQFGMMPPAQTGQPAQTPYMTAPAPGTPTVQAPVALPPPLAATPNPAPLNLPQIPGYTPPGLPIQQGGMSAPTSGTGMASPGAAQ